MTCLDGYKDLNISDLSDLGTVNYEQHCKTNRSFRIQQIILMEISHCNLFLSIYVLFQAACAKWNEIK